MLTSCKMSHKKAELHADQKVWLKAITLNFPTGLRKLKLLTSKGFAKRSS